MRYVKFFLAAVCATALWAGAASAGDYGKQKVVYHINYDGGEGNKAYKSSLQNIQNHINAVGADNMQVKVVLHGDGVWLLREATSDDGVQVAVATLKSQNVEFNICANTLEGRKIDYDKDLYEVFEEDIVPSGVAELSRLQQQGYTYIKP